jgi:hypothetical protein
VRVLSGGERRRIALAAQLMGGPRLLLLDEPLSGLDPVNAEKLCSHLRQLAWLGHTIILTTHSYAALEISDRVLVLHEGAQAFFGNREDAYRFFNSEDADALLTRLLQKSGADWSSLYQRSSFAQKIPESSNSVACILFPQAPRSSFLLRDLRIEFLQWFRDRGRLAAILLQPLLIGLLLRQVFQPGASLWAAAFALLLCANWFALSLSIRSIVSERSLLADELRSGSSILALLSAKAVFPFLIASLQTLACWYLYGPALSASPAPILLYAAIATTLLPAAFAGIAASAFCRNTGQANALLPLLLIPQVALAGALAPRDQMSAAGRFLAEALWSSHTQSLLQDLLTLRPLLSHSFIIPLAVSAVLFAAAGYLLVRLRRGS